VLTHLGPESGSKTEETQLSFQQIIQLVYYGKYFYTIPVGKTDILNICLEVAQLF
jgi:hypothetical protein